VVEQDDGVAGDDVGAQNKRGEHRGNFGLSLVVFRWSTKVSHLRRCCSTTLTTWG